MFYVTDRAKPSHHFSFPKVMLDTLITSKTRIKLLLRFFLNSSSSSYLRNLETEFGESTNAIRVELNRFEKAGLLVSGMEMNRKIFRANTKHPLFDDISNIIRKYVGFDQLIEKVMEQLGSVDKAYITGDLALGRDSKRIDLLLYGKNIDRICLDQLAKKTGNIINRKIHYKILTDYNPEEFEKTYPKAFEIWRTNGEK
jgi:hypothetical protein